MKILFISSASDFGIAYRVQEAGHKVMGWAPNNFTQVGLMKYLFKGDFMKVVPKADLVVCDDTLSADTEHLDKIKKPIVVGNKLFTKIEEDRLFGKLAFQKCGLLTSDCIHFTDFKKAMAWVKANPGRYVFKANGQASRTLGFVAKDDQGKDMLERLAFYETHLKSNKKLWDEKLGVDFVLERAVDGIEVACGAYWDGTDFAAININWEHKRLGVGNVGVATGEMGTAVSALSSESRLFRDTLAKLRPLLEASPYHTYVDLNCIINKDKAYILEVTSRLGWPMEAILDAMSRIPTAERYWRLATGTLHSEEYWKDKWGIAVNVGTYGFPYECAYKEFGQEQPFELPKGKEKQIYLICVNKSNNHLETSEHGDGLVCTITGSSDTLSGARTKAFDVVEEFDLPGKMYREDIGEKVPEHLKDLKKWGWL